LLKKRRDGHSLPRCGRPLVSKGLGVAVLATVALAAAQGLGAVDPTLAYAATLEGPPVPDGLGLPDGRVYELVSPPKKNGNEAGVSTAGEEPYGVASMDGNRVLYANSGPIGEANSGVDGYSVSTRTPLGWETKAVLPAPVPGPPPHDTVSRFDPVSLLPSADLSSVAFTAHNPFAPSGVDFENPEFSFASTYTSHEGAPATWIGAPTVETPLPALEEVEVPGNLSLTGASSDLSTVYYEYYGTLVGEDEPRRAVVAEGNIRAWGLYEWRDEHLKAAGLLPSKEGKPEEEDPYGAVAAAIGEQPRAATPVDFDNEVSRSGNTALFVSPAPRSGSGRPSELYARLEGNRTILISRSELTGLPAADGADAVSDLGQAHVTSYAYASPDGTHVLFASQDQLTSDAPADTSVKEYQFDITSNTLSYLPGVTPPILATSEDGTTFAFDHTSSGENELAIWAGGKVTDVTPLPKPGESEEIYVAPINLAASSSVVVFQTNATIPGFNDGGGFGEIFRYDMGTEGLSCVSCPPHEQAPVGGANLSNDTLTHLTRLIVDSRGVTEDGGDIFFDTPDALVPQDKNGVRDVYEWHEGHVSLLTSGTSPSNSFFLDNSSSGGDVFFATKDDLGGEDLDGSYDVYDARVGGGFPVSTPPPGCSGECSPPRSPLLTATLSSASLLGQGEQVPPPAGPGKPLTRAQKLARSLRACRRKHGKRRHSCEAQARGRYGKHPTKRRSG
jgi:hypothetical protein